MHLTVSGTEQGIHGKTNHNCGKVAKHNEKESGGLFPRRNEPTGSDTSVTRVITNFK
jgi:hypothetical protein